MSERALQRIIGSAVTDPQFQAKLLDGNRQTVLADFDLTAEERKILLCIQANSLQEFAARLEEQLQMAERAPAAYQRQDMHRRLSQPGSRHAGR